MTSEVNLVSFIVSALVGIASGALVGWKLQWPKSIAWLIVITIVGALSPWIMTTGWAFAYSDLVGNTTGIHIGRWLTFFCATVIVAFGVRLLKARKVATNETL